MSKKTKNKISRTHNALTALASPAGAERQMIGTMLMQALQLHQQGQLERAASLYDAVLNIDPVNFDALHLRGSLESDRGRHESAVRLIGRALTLRPSSVHARQNLGIALRNLKRFDEALAVYDQALQLDARNADLFNNRGNVLLELGRHDEALASYNQAVSLAPNFVDAHDNRGNALRELHRFDEALASYACAQALASDFASAHWNEALCHLLMGNLSQGWEKYEWGWKLGTRGQPRNFPQPLWLGHDSLHGKTILLHSEQGFGDTIHFCRYVQDVAALGACVILEVQPALKSLMGCLHGAARVIARGDPLPAFDWHCPLASLPLAFGSDLANIPSASPYLTADVNLTQEWALRLGPRDGLRVGIAWSGNPLHTRDALRSLPLQVMAKLCEKPLRFFSLQKDLPASDQAALAQAPSIQHFGENFGSFADTAALTSLMDVVISVDTSIAHLAAALGCPTWILLPHTPDWRWLLHRADSPWYSTVRLFRQPAPGDWESVMGQIQEALRALKPIEQNR
jgi:tetratricopeptide (TPR) repeat protein